MTVSVDSRQATGAEQITDDLAADPAAVPEPATGPRPDPATAAPTRPAETWAHTVARQTASVSAKLTPIAARAGDRVAGASPITLLLGLLGVLTTLSIVASLTIDGSLGVASAMLFVPTLSAAIGAVGMRCVDERRNRQTRHEDSRHEATQLRNLEHTLDYVDTKLTAALTQFGSDRHGDAVIAMFQAKAATELYLGSDAAPQRNPAHSEAITKADSASRYPLPDWLSLD